MSSDKELIDRLLATAPNWVALQAMHASNKAEILANPLRASHTPTRTYKIIVDTNGNRVVVREAESSRLLPTFCPQRHLNSDGTFCLGLNAGDALNDDLKARAWWKKLLVFLTCQDTAFETRTWPKSIEISHGPAGPIEVHAETTAEELGLLEEYRRAVDDDAGFIAAATRRISAITERLRNGRAKCVCGRKNRKGKTKLRRECQADGDMCLPKMEAKRRNEEKKFWESLRGKFKCCGTMNDCPLKDSAQ